MFNVVITSTKTTRNPGLHFWIVYVIKTAPNVEYAEKAGKGY